jgi:hypothetical protein
LIADIREIIEADLAASPAEIPHHGFAVALRRFTKRC